MKGFERRLNQRLEFESDVLREATPGVVIEAWYRGRRAGRVEWGKTYPYYDLASLTKIIFTSSVAVQYFSDHRAELKQPLSRHLPWTKLRATPYQLLSHTAGLEWWLPMYKKLKGPLVPEKRWAQLEKRLAQLKPKKRDQAVYSDPDLWMMGAYLRAAKERELLELWQENVEALRLRGLFFHPGNRPRYKRSLYAPTEKCPWRGKTLQGEVHDENCWSFGGVSSHAGLFGTMDGVVRWGLEVRRAWRGDSKRFGDSKVLRYFMARRIPKSVGDWGLGFMKPSRPGASCGRYFSSQSAGHTGFTGTSFWLDPKRDLMVVILSNRVHPTRKNGNFVKLRPLLHNWVVESLNKESK
ncbi:MAG: serine hydrolase domain-containing protein [Bdellovibrionales bacterium]